MMKKQILLSLITLNPLNQAAYAGGCLSSPEDHSRYRPQLRHTNSSIAPSDDSHNRPPTPKPGPAEIILFRNISEAIQQDNHEAVERLLQEVDTPFINETPSRHRPLLHEAVLLQCPISVALLIKKGIDVNIQDADGNTALHIAMNLTTKITIPSDNEYPEEPIITPDAIRAQTLCSIMSQLLVAGGSLHIKNNNNEAPLDLTSALDLSIILAAEKRNQTIDCNLLEWPVRL